MRARAVRTVLGAALLALAGGAAAAAAAPGLTIVYTDRDAARAIHDGAPGVPGLHDAWRQAPIFDDARWPAGRQMAKVGGSELAGQDAAGMAATLRAALRDPAAGGRAAVDELNAGEWDEARLASLRDALGRLGGDAARVSVYVGPGLVSQMGRRDPRAPLPARLAAVLDTLRLVGAVELTMYHGGGEPFSRAEMAAYPTRWLARWAPGDPGALHLVLGPDRGVGEDTIWSWARATPAGRQILANGPSVWGLRTADEGRAWLAAYRAFLADPAGAPAGGETPVPQGGGLTLAPAGGRRMTIGLARTARTVVRVQSVAGGPSRTVAKLYGPFAARTLVLPRDMRPGEYRVIAVALGDGLRDVAVAPLVVRGRP